MAFGWRPHYSFNAIYRFIYLSRLFGRLFVLYYNVYILDLVSFLIVLYTYINIIFYILFYLFSWYLRGLQSDRPCRGATFYLTTASDSSPLPLLGNPLYI